jgi:ribosome-associated protein
LAIHDFPLQGDFIELNVLLKLIGLAPSGGAAKAMISEGAVRVGKTVENRIRRKLRAGDIVKLGDETIRIINHGTEKT